MSNLALVAQLNVLLLREEEIQYNLLLRGAHKIAMAMEYLTQVITVLITLIEDASKKIQQHNSNLLLLLIELGTRQDRVRYGNIVMIKNNNTPYMRTWLHNS